MSAPYDKAFKLLAEDEDLGLLRVVARLHVPEGARIEHLDRELDLATLRVDHLYRITDGVDATAVHLEAFSSYNSDWRKRHGRYGALIWVQYDAKLISYMFLLTDRGVPAEIDEWVDIDAGDLRIRMRVRIVRLWEVPAEDLLRTGDPALMAWVPLTNATPEELETAVEVVAASGDPELRTRMALLHGMRYLESEGLESMLTEELAQESAFYQKILSKGIRQGRQEGREEGLRMAALEGDRRMLRHLIVQKFNSLPASMDERIAVAPADDLARWATRLLTVTSIDEVLD